MGLTNMLANSMTSTNGGKNGSISLYSTLPGMPNKGNKLLAQGYQLQTTTFDPFTKQYVWIFVKNPSPVATTIVQQSDAPPNERIETLEKLLKEQTYLASLTEKQKLEYQKKKAEQEKKEAEEAKQKEEREKIQQAKNEEERKKKEEKDKISEAKNGFIISAILSIVLTFVVLPMGIGGLMASVLYLIKWRNLVNRKEKKNDHKTK